MSSFDWMGGGPGPDAIPSNPKVSSGEATASVPEAIAPHGETFGPMTRFGDHWIPVNQLETISFGYDVDEYSMPYRYCDLTFTDSQTGLRLNAEETRAFALQRGRAAPTSTREGTSNVPRTKSRNDRQIVINKCILKIQATIENMLNKHWAILTAEEEAKLRDIKEALDKV